MSLSAMIGKMPGTMLSRIPATKASGAPRSIAAFVRSERRCFFALGGFFGFSGRWREDPGAEEGEPGEHEVEDRGGRRPARARADRGVVEREDDQRADRDRREEPAREEAEQDPLRAWPSGRRSRRRGRASARTPRGRPVARRSSCIAASLGGGAWAQLAAFRWLSMASIRFSWASIFLSSCSSSGIVLGRLGRPARTRRARRRPT